MATFLIIVSTTNSVEVAANDYGPVMGFAKTSFGKDKVKRIDLSTNSDYVIVEFIQGEIFYVTHDASVGFQVDLVDTVAPSGASDLYDKLKALIA